MQKVTEQAIRHQCEGVFTLTEVRVWFPKNTPDSIRALIKRAIGSKEVIRVHRGVYCLEKCYRKELPNPFTLANLLYGPSYISFETALSYFGWIPEAVYSIDSVCLGRSVRFPTPLGIFTYTRIPMRELAAGVQYVTENGISVPIATPLKALADLVTVRKLEWESARPLMESLRIEPESLESLPTRAFREMEAVYPNAGTVRFLQGLRKELGK